MTVEEAKIRIIIIKKSMESNPGYATTFLLPRLTAEFVNWISSTDAVYSQPSQVKAIADIIWNG